MSSLKVIPVEKGADLRLSLTLRNTETGVVLDLTGATFAVVENTLPFSPIIGIVNALTGNALLTATEAQMNTLAKGKRYSFKVKMTAADTVKTVFPAITLSVAE